MSDRQTATEDVVRDAQRLKALSHPIRIAVLWRLIMDGPQRTLDLARAVDEPANKVSYHLTALQRGGFITPAEPPAGAIDGRESWWQASSPDGFSLDTNSSELLPHLGAFSQMFSGLIGQFREASYPLRPRWPFVENNAEVVLTHTEAADIQRRLRELLDETLALRHRGQPDEPTAAYLCSVDFFATRENDPASEEGTTP